MVRVWIIGAIALLLASPYVDLVGEWLPFILLGSIYPCIYISFLIGTLGVLGRREAGWVLIMGAIIPGFATWTPILKGAAALYGNEVILPLAILIVLGLIKGYKWRIKSYEGS